MKEKDYVISVGIQQTADLRHLDEAVAKAEAAMRQDRQAYYDHNGRARQLEGLNERWSAPCRKSGMPSTF